MICRDRAGAYADGATRGAPGAIQVADRWHLWHNLCQHAEKTAARHRGCLAGAVPQDPAAARAEAGSTLARDVRERYERVMELHAQGQETAPIARHAGLALQTVRRYLRAGSLDELLAVILDGPPAPLDPCKPYLAQRWAEGCHSATALHAGIRDRGYPGSYNGTAAHLRKLRQQGTLPPAPPAPPKTRDITRWILPSPASFGDADTAALARARQECPHLDALARHVTAFATMLAGLHGDRLDDWLAAVENDDGQPDLQSLARGIRRDHDAVRNGLTLPWSSGPVEGLNCKIKHIMYGRASFDLLRKMALHN